VDANLISFITPNLAGISSWLIPVSGIAEGAAFGLSSLLPSLVAATSFWLNPESYWAIARVALGLGLVIFIHELGHFLVAKACGVKCDKFYVGFDAFDIKIGDTVIIPRSLLKFQWGETEYGLGILPLGGYVKMLGQDDNPGNYEQELQRSRQDGGTEEDVALAQAGIVDREKLDPRSFLSKTVLQRMAIISAGVIFNMVSAIFFAAFAFKSGVNYTPPVVGKVIGGGPAWEADLAGATIEQIGERKLDGYFTWVDLAEQFVFHGDKSPMDISFIPHNEAEPRMVQMTPRKGLNRQVADLALGGLTQPLDIQVSELGAIKGNTAALADPPILPKDRIVSVNQYPIKNVVDLHYVLLRDAEMEAEFELERKVGDQTQLVRTKIAPNPCRTVGFSMEWLPISNLKQGSPAEQAGLQVGDEIVSVNGQPRGDLLNLDQRLIKLAREGQSVELEIRREDAVQIVTLFPVVPRLGSVMGDNQPIAIDSLGVAIPINQTIDWIEIGSPAEGVLQVGDEIVSVRILLNPEQQGDQRYQDLNLKPVRLLADRTSWAEIEGMLQKMEAGTTLELTLIRQGKEETVNLATGLSETFFQDMRGIGLNLLSAHYQSGNWSDAFKYGTQQVGGDLKKVLKTLAKLFRGEISPTNLGGPGTIAMVATSEATQGNSRLLLFLAFLSANLAIVNLLPIPVLDGGHLLFLAYEGIFRKPVDERMQVILSYIGLALILSLMLFVIALDIGRISSLLM
jgi:regulator of sigma E protease